MNNKIDCGIYIIKNSITKDCYIGQSIHLIKRKNDHLSMLKRNNHTNIYLQRSYNKYGKENFKFEIILYCEPFELTRYEQILVNKLNPKYNLLTECVNSIRGYKFREETKQKMRQPRTEEHKKNISLATKGRTFSKETRQKLSVANKGSNNYMFGKHHPEERKKKIAEGNKNKIVTQESKEKMSMSQSGSGNNFYGGKHTEEFGKNMFNLLVGRKRIKNASSKYIGVYFEKRRKRWIATIRIFKKSIYLGSFKNEIDAALTYNKAAIKYHGVNARTNIII